MLILVIPVTSLRFAKQKIREFISRVDGYELRFDYLTNFDFEEIKKIRQGCAKPLIFTLRSKAQGGLWLGDEAQRWNKLHSLCACLPDYIDLEYDVSFQRYIWVKKNFPSIKIISSYHNFDAKNTSLFRPSHQAFDILKISQYCETGLQALEFLYKTYQAFKTHPLVAIAMGAHAKFSRVLGPILGNHFDYVCIDEDLSTGPGQLTIDEALSVYHYRALNAQTKVYALIGKPVEHSIGHLYHNTRFRQYNHNAVYVKIDIGPKDLEQSLYLLTKFPVLGLSVTMPLKKHVAKLLSKHFTSVNTLMRVGTDQWHCFNTDGLGALKAVLQYEPDIKPVLIIGAGGAALAIAQTFIAHQYPVYSVNPRSLITTKDLGVVLSEDVSQYPKLGIVINTLPACAYYSGSQALTLAQSILKPCQSLLNIDYGHHSQLDSLALNLGCTIIPGLDMFNFQAQEQSMIWLHQDDS